MLEILPKNSSLSHDSAHLHVAGESEFIDDRAFLHDELHVGVVTSPHAKAQIISIDFSKVLELENFVCGLTAKDLMHNRWGSIICEQPIIADKYVNYVGEVVAVIACKNILALREALKLVKVSYKILEPILSIEEAIKNN